MSILGILVLVYTPLTVLKNLSFNHSELYSSRFVYRAAHNLSVKHRGPAQLVRDWRRKGAAGCLEMKLLKLDAASGHNWSVSSNKRRPSTLQELRFLVFFAKAANGQTFIPG